MRLTACRYAVTPRFAPTSTDLQLHLAGQLAKEHPTVHVHTHLCENTEEVNLVKALFAGRDYLGVYAPLLTHSTPLSRLFL
jgi:guanine deaminase